MAMPPSAAEHRNGCHDAATRRQQVLALTWGTLLGEVLLLLILDLKVEAAHARVQDHLAVRKHRSQRNCEKASLSARKGSSSCIDGAPTELGDLEVLVLLAGET